MSAPRHGRIVILGGGPAAAASAVALRNHGHDGEIVMLSEETWAPYSRPPLSKAFLRGEVSHDDLTLSIADAELITGTRANHVDLEAQKVHRAHGEPLAYDGLVIATGTRARRQGSSRAQVLQTLDDATQLAGRLSTSHSAIIVGSGFLAYQVASAAHALGVATTLVIKPGALAEKIGVLADILLSRARDAGITVIESPTCTIADSSVTLADATRIDAQCVVAAIGSDPHAPLAQQGSDGGVVVDDYCRLRPNVVAAGDVAIMRTGAGLCRDPSCTNALAQGAAAAHSLIDLKAPPYVPVRYGWTEAFGLDIKIAGDPPRGIQPALVDGQLDEHRALLRWPGGAAAVGYRIPVANLKKLVQPATLVV